MRLRRVDETDMVRAVSPNGRWVITYEPDGTEYLCELSRQRTVLHRIKLGRASYHQSQFNASGSTVISSTLTPDGDGVEYRLWTLRDNHLMPNDDSLQAKEGDPAVATLLGSATKDHAIMSVSADKQHVAFYDEFRGACVASVSGKMGYDDSVDTGEMPPGARRFQLSSDGKVLAAEYVKSNTIIVKEVRGTKRRVVVKVPEAVGDRYLRWDIDDYGTALLYRTSDGTIAGVSYLWRDGGEVINLVTPEHKLTNAQLAPRGGWCVITREKPESLEVVMPDPVGKGESRIPLQLNGSLRELFFEPQGRWLAIATDLGLVSVFTVDSSSVTVDEIRLQRESTFVQAKGGMRFYSAASEISSSNDGQILFVGRAFGTIDRFLIPNREANLAELVANCHKTAGRDFNREERSKYLTFLSERESGQSITKPR